MLVAVAAQTTAWVGSFQLVLNLEPSDLQLDRLAVLQFAECPQAGQENVFLQSARNEHSELFADVQATSDGKRSATIRCSGRSNLLGLLNQYHEPSSIILRYKMDGDGDWKTSIVQLPKGRGDRSVRVQLQ